MWFREGLSGFLPGQSPAPKSHIPHLNGWFAIYPTVISFFSQPAHGTGKVPFIQNKQAAPTLNFRFKPQNFVLGATNVPQAANLRSLL